MRRSDVCGQVYSGDEVICHYINVQPHKHNENDTNGVKLSDLGFILSFLIMENCLVSSWDHRISAILVTETKTIGSWEKPEHLNTNLCVRERRGGVIQFLAWYLVSMYIMISQSVTVDYITRTQHILVHIICKKCSVFSAQCRIKKKKNSVVSQHLKVAF